MNLDFTIKKLSFFRGPRGSLRFTEHYPMALIEDEHEFECNCTKNATERPTGVPESIAVYVEARTPLDGRDFWFRSWRPDALEFTFHWGEAIKLPTQLHPDHDSLLKPERPHAFFWYDRLKHKANIQIHKAGYGVVNCTLFDMYFGNEVDTKTIYNGHAKSKVVEASKLRSSDVWMYKSWEQEHYEVLAENPETQQWRIFEDDANAILAMLTPHYESDASVQSIYQKINEMPRLKSLVSRQADFLSQIIRELDTTEMFRAGNACWEATDWRKHDD